MFQELLEEMPIVTNPFEEIKTMHKQKKYFEESQYSVKPLEITITIGNALRFHAASGEVRYAHTQNVSVCTN